MWLVHLLAQMPLQLILYRPCFLLEVHLHFLQEVHLVHLESQSTGLDPLHWGLLWNWWMSQRKNWYHRYEIPNSEWCFYLQTVEIVVMMFSPKCLWWQFYFQNGRPPPNELKERCLFRINQFFYGHTDGLQMNGKFLFTNCFLWRLWDDYWFVNVLSAWDWKTSCSRLFFWEWTCSRLNPL